MYLYVQYTITQYLYILLVKYQYWGMGQFVTLVTPPV